MALALLVARLALAAVFATAGVAKLADLEGSRGAVVAFGVPRRLARLVGTVLPLVELAAAAALLPDRTARVGALAALVLLLSFSGAIALSLRRGRAPECRCFGQVHSAPVSWRAVGRNLGLAVLAAAILATGERAALSRPEIAGIGAAILLGAVLLVWRGARRREEAAARAPSMGLPIGAEAPQFELSALDGGTVTLAALRERGKPVLLVFADIHCGPCVALAPEIAHWQREHTEALTIAVIERGHDPGATGPDEHARSDVLLQEGDEVASAYGAVGTPVAALVDANGRIASELAPGADPIRRLVASETDVGEVAQDARALERFAGQTADRVLPPIGDGPLTRLELIARLASASAILAFLAPARAWAGAVPLVIKCRYGPFCGGRCCPKTARCRTRAGKRVCVCPDGRKACGDRCCPPALECRRPRRGKPFCVCPAGTTRCGDRCVSTRRDPANCGSCGNTCPPATSCVQGACVGGDGTGTGPGGTAPCDCPPGQACCGGACTDLNADEGHCGRCDTPCPSGQTCCSGTCKDLQSDPRNCGECGKRCPSGQVCADGRCGNACPPGQANCDGRCVDTQSDASNCGRCGTGCTGPFDTGECCAGKCCDYLADTCCPDGCKNLALDDDNCGGCGNVCGPGSYCRFGVCASPL